VKKHFFENCARSEVNRITKNPHRVGRGGFFGWVIPAGAGVCYFLRASSRALALAMTSSETFFGQGA
jgi:hypothetical protein